METDAEIEAAEELFREMLRQQEEEPTQVGEALRRARDSEYPWVREAVLQQLPVAAATEPQWRALIHASLSDREYDVRKAAAEAVGRLHLAEEAPALIPLLRDREELVRVEAVETLTELRVTSAVSDLEHLVRHDRSWLVRGYAAWGLATICGETALPILEQRLQVERSPWTRAQLLLEAYILGKEELLPQLLKCLKSRNYRVRCSVSNHVRWIVNPSNHQKVMDAFTAALNRETTVAAGEALGRAVKHLQQMAA